MKTAIAIFVTLAAALYTAYIYSDHHDHDIFAMFHSNYQVERPTAPEAENPQFNGALDKAVAEIESEIPITTLDYRLQLDNYGKLKPLMFLATEKPPYEKP
jgi:hypothetical protein